MYMSVDRTTAGYVHTCTEANEMGNSETRELGERALFDSLAAPAVLKLKVRAKVLSICNLKDGYVKTGTQGTVVGFTSPTNLARGHLGRWQYNYGITSAMAAEDWPRISSMGRWPIVEWIDSTKPVDAPDRIMSMLPVYPYRCTLEDGSPSRERRFARACSCFQGLLLAYGLTVHRAQGIDTRQCRV